MNYKAHDALQDVWTLQALYGALQPTAEMISRHRFTLDTIVPKLAGRWKVKESEQPFPVEALQTAPEKHDGEHKENLSH